MRIQQDKVPQEAFMLSDDGHTRPGMLTRDITIEQSDVVKSIGECPLTLRASIEGWNTAEMQNNYYINEDEKANNDDALDFANTPHYQVPTVRSNRDCDAGIQTAHREEGIYQAISRTGTIEVVHRPTIALGDLNKTIEIGAVVYRGMHEEKFDQPHQDSITTTKSYRFEQPRPMWHFVHAITSNEVMQQAEDWGIDRSIYTRYARCGFFADCNMADSLHHGEYLNVKDCENFAECRMPLIVCIISASRETRLHEVQKGIVPLAVNILDRYVMKHKNTMARLVSIAYSHCETSRSEGGSNPASLASSMSAREFSALDSISMAKALKGQYTHDHVIKFCFKFTGDDNRDAKNQAKEVVENPYQDKQTDARDCNVYEDDSENDNDFAIDRNDRGLFLKFDVIYNLIAAACFFVADRYNGHTNTSVKALLYKWESSCHIFTKTKDAAMYIRENRATALSIIMSFMFDIYFVLEYKLTTPFPCHMVQDLILSTPEFRCSQNPVEHSLYQKIAAVLARISYVDDTFHRFKPSIVTLSIYNLISGLAINNGLFKEDDGWLLVDQGDPEIVDCSHLLASTMQQFLNTDLLDVLVQPVYMKHQGSELFTHVFEDLCDEDAHKLSEISTTLLALSPMSI